MRMSLRVRRYLNVFLSATLPFFAAAVFTMPNLFLGLHWGGMNWLMQPLATVSLVLSPIAWFLFVLMGVSWARFKKLHKIHTNRGSSGRTYKPRALDRFHYPCNLDVARDCPGSSACDLSSRGCSQCASGLTNHGRRTRETRRFVQR